MEIDNEDSKRNNLELDLKIAFVFIVKDGEEYLIRNINRIKKFKKDIYAVENDSVDNTKKLLIESGLTKVINLNLDTMDSLDLCAGGAEINCNKRTRRLGYLRQTGLESIMNSGINYDYMCMLDLDFVDFDDKKLFDMFIYMEKHKNVDGIFGMSRNSWNVFPYDTGAILPKSKIISIAFKMQRYIQVDSAFSGFGIYRYSSLKRYDAKYDYEKLIGIEHFQFNSQFNKLIVDTHFNPIYHAHGLSFVIKKVPTAHYIIAAAFLVFIYLCLPKNFRFRLPKMPKMPKLKFRNYRK